MRRAFPLALAIVLVAALPPLLSAGTPQGAAMAWRSALIIDSATAHPAKMFEAFDTASLSLFDFNGDGQLEIVSLNDNNHAYVLDSRTGAVLSEIVTTHPGGDNWPVRDMNPIATGALYGNGVPCMVIPNGAAYLSAWCYDAVASNATSFNFTKKWEVRVDAALYERDFKTAHPWMFDPDGKLNKTYELGLDGNAFMASVDGPNSPKTVFVETDGYPGQLAFAADGSYRWSHSWYDGNAGPKVLDIDKDGRKDVCFASDAGEVACYDAKTGGVKWSFHARDHGAYPGSIPVSPGYFNLYGDGKYEVFFGARNAVYGNNSTSIPSNRDPTYDRNWMNETHAQWFLLDSKGDLVWNVSYDWMNPLAYNHPAATDINGDGVLDLVSLDWNTIGHKPGEWEPTNRPSNLFALDGRDGSVLWRTSVGSYWSNKDFVIGDGTGDGKLDVIISEPKWGNEGIGLYDLYSGKNKGWFPTDWAGQTRGPVAGDLYGDGKLELVVPISRHAPGTNYRSLDVGWREGALQIIATDSPYKVTFSANFLLSDDQKETVTHGITARPPTPTTPPTPTPTTTTPVVTTTPASTTAPVVTTAPANATPPTTNASLTAPPPTSRNTTTTTSTPPQTSPGPSASTTTTTTAPAPSQPLQPAVGLRVPGPTLGIIVAAASAAVIVARPPRR
ncbi:MAG: hypothetical protein WDA16_05985 [Candidatus Thermoplasmatota archaeon]